MSPTRLRILLAGLALFGDRGYHGTSIRDIAAEAGMQSASLYSHFASKEAILAELTFIGHDVHHRMLLAALRLSNAILTGLLFLVGFHWARYVGANPWWTGTAMMGLGVALVAVAIALGG